MNRIVENVRRNLAIKTAVLGFFAACVFITVLLAVNYYFVSQQMLEAYQLKAETIATYLDSSIQNYGDLDDREKNFTRFQKHIWLDTDLLNISMYRVNGETMIGVISSHGKIEGAFGDNQNLQALKEDRVIMHEMQNEDGNLIRVYAPIHIARQRVGSFQFDITLENLHQVQFKMFQAMFAVNFVLILLIIGFLFFYLRRNVIRPLYQISDAAEKISGGDLDTRVSIQSTDEFGQLGQDFNNMAQNLKLQQKQLRQSQKMDAIGQLTGGIAHDFNNLLGIIIGHLGLLKYEYSENEKALKRVNTIGEVAQRAADVVRQLLGFSRLQATDVLVSNINESILDMDILIKPTITPEVEVRLLLADSLWLTGINRGDFQDSLLNMILNARDAMPNGGLLTIQTENCTLDATYCAGNPDLGTGDYVKLSVIDTGTGIPSEQQDKIYEPFYTTKEVGKGVGLGLSMVFGFITRSKGYIEVVSEPGQGTAFHVYLPRAEEQCTAAPVAGEEIDQLPRGSETILVVDDEIELLHLAKETLEALGYHILMASNGKEALTVLTKNPDISLLFSDVIMPGGMNGYELAFSAHELYPSLKVLVTSGFNKERGEAINDKTQFYSKLTSSLVNKPYNKTDLALAVRNALDEEIPW